jgi:hypothetical protein
LVPVALAFGLPTFFVFAYFGTAARGFAAALSVCSATAVVVTSLNLRKYISFWIVMSACLVAHAALVSSIPPDTDSHFAGIIFAPLVVADILFWQFVSVSIVRMIKL